AGAAAWRQDRPRPPGGGWAMAGALTADYPLANPPRAVAAGAPRLTHAAEVARVAAPLFAGARVERLLVLICDTQHRLRRHVFVAEGAVDRVAVPVREILNTVLRHDGRSFAVVHNHPSGDPHPSPDDRRATTLLHAAATTVGLRFLDHIVLAGEHWSRAAPLDDAPY
uniref:JAB domain-containing protein n=1 Tax=Nocardia farcinica TaxID=37329 RepID=UPI002458E934